MRKELLNKAREFYMKHGALSIVFLMYKLQIKAHLAESLQQEILDEHIHEIQRKELAHGHI
jgi:hypothetical protein